MWRIGASGSGINNEGSSTYGTNLRLCVCDPPFPTALPFSARAALGFGVRQVAQGRASVLLVHLCEEEMFCINTGGLWQVCISDFNLSTITAVNPRMKGH